MNEINNLKSEFETDSQVIEKFQNSSDSLLISQILSTLNLDDLLNFFAEALRLDYSYQGFYIALEDEKKQNLIIQKLRLIDKQRELEPILLKSRLPIEQKNFISQIYKENQTIFVDAEDIENYSEDTKKTFSLWKLKYGVYIPFSLQKNSETEIIGYVFLMSSKNEFLKEELQRIKDLIYLFYHQIKNSLSYQRFQEQEQEIKIASEKTKKVLELAEKITNLSSSHQIYSLILDEIFLLYHFQIGLIFIENQENLDYASGSCIQKDSIQELFSKLDLFFKNSNGYRIHFMDGATPTAFIRGVHFYFPSIPQIVNLPMAQKDKDGIALLDNPQTLLIIPILKNKKPVGCIQLWGIEETVRLSENDLNILITLSSFIGTSISNAYTYSLVDEQKRKLEEKNNIIQKKNHQFKDELHLASQIQRNLVPSVAPEVHGIQVAMYYKPMENIGGDFYDFIHFKESSLFGIFISDVSGHGVPAALITGMIKALIETSDFIKFFPAKLLYYINEKITGQTGGNFLTVFYALYNSETKILKYARGAHPYPLLVRNGEISFLESKGKMLGIIPDTEFEEKEIQLLSGDKLIFFTDGLTETENSEGIEFDEILPQILKDHPDKNPEKLLETIYHSLLSFKEDYSFEDDICLIVMGID